MINCLKIEKFRQFSNMEFCLGKRITIIAGHNAVGKSTLLGILGHMVELKDINIFGKQYRTEFSEIFKGSKEFDKTGEHKGEVFFSDVKDFDEIIDTVSFRSTWQKETRFRLIPSWTNKEGKKTEAKYSMPVIYLGLSRLYPLGETTGKLENDNLNLTDLEKKWFIHQYKQILSLSDDINDISNIKTKDVKANFTGVTTDSYDALCNSAGQDNLGQLLLAILSFKRLKAKLDCWGNGILLIDELDAALHPVAQENLLNFLFKMAKELDIQVIFTTHSLSILECVSKKYENNDNFTNDYKLFFISNANVVLKKYDNPSFELIKNNLCLTTSHQENKNNKILVYSEDDDTRWFFKKIISGYNNKVKLISANFGCTELQKMLKEDNGYFSKVLIVVDGDVKITAKAFVKKPNVLALIGEERPEKILYDFLNGSQCKFWENDAMEEQGITQKYIIKENGPFSDKYKSLSEERKKFSSWFYDHKSIFEKYKLIEIWKRENVERVNKFRNEFIIAFNKIAEKEGVSLISQKGEK